MTKVLITGISGFAGSHLAEHLLKQGGYELFGTYLDDKSITSLSHILDQIKLTQVNLLERDGVQRLIQDTSPEHIYHLAALTSPKDSFDDPTSTFVNNVSAQINILESAKEGNSRILVVSSAEVYGLVKKEDLPIDEETPFNPSNPYAVSKLTQDFLGLQYFLSHKLDIVRVRPFNHVGPRQSPALVVSSFAKKIAEIEKTDGNEITVGNLNSRRDFTDVRDMVKAYELAMIKGESGSVYNIGRGESHEIGEILNMLISYSDKKIKVKADPSLFRPADNPELLCDVSKFENLTGWKAEIPIEQTLKDTLDYWRNSV
jgi:GDP-4-dehydro-6-deoxy-D-mannose reductase